MFIIHFMITFCSQQALKYQNILSMHREIKGIEHIYAVGLAITKRDEWLKKVKWLQKIIKR